MRVAGSGGITSADRTRRGAWRHGGSIRPFAQSHLIRPTIRTSTHTFCATIFWGARSGRRGTPPYISPVSRREPRPCEPVPHMGQSGQGGRRAEANQDGGDARRAWQPRYIEGRQQRSCTTSAHTTEAHKRTTALTSILLGTSPCATLANQKRAPVDPCSGSGRALWSMDSTPRGPARASPSMATGGLG